jgi:hypothetical protein
MIICKVNNNSFLPENCLRNLVTVSRIKEELWAELGYIQLLFNSQLAERVYEKAPKVFAILSLMCHVKAIKDVDQEGLTDEHLPLGWDQMQPGILVSLSSGKTFKSLGRYAAGAPMLFDEKQWQVQAPVLDMSGKHAKHLILNEKCALPIVAPDDEEAKSGGGSAILKGTIHEAHCEGLEVCTGPEVDDHQHRLSVL